MPNPVDVNAENALERRREQLEAELYELQAAAAAHRVRRAVEEGDIPPVRDVMGSPD
jgi:hypothetical protein